MVEILLILFYVPYISRLARSRGRRARWGVLSGLVALLAELIAFALAYSADVPLWDAYQVALSALAVAAVSLWAVVSDPPQARGHERGYRDRLLDRSTLPLRVGAAVTATAVVTVVAPTADRWPMAALALVVLFLMGPRWSAAIGGGAALATLAPPLNLSWLHWFVFLPMFWALRPGEGRANRWLAFGFGTAAVFFIFSWISDTIIIFSNIPAALAYLATALFATAFGLPYVLLWGSVHPLRRRLGTWWILLFPSLQVAIEFVSMYVLLFPYNQAVSQYRVESLVQITSVTGILGITWLLCFANAALGEALYRLREGRSLPWAWLAAPAVLVAGVMLWGSQRYARIERVLAESRVLGVAQIQVHMDMQEVMARYHHRWVADWVERTREVPHDGSVDLVIWPEGAAPNNPTEWNEYGPQMAALAQRGDFEMVVGGGWWEVVFKPGTRVPERAYVFNSIFHLREDGKVHGRYDKLVPLPFGEYIPLADTFPWLRDLIKGPGDFKAGTEAVVFEGRDLRIAAPICYEAILPQVCRRFEDPNLFVNVTNDAWFGDTAAPHQHAMLATFRATELGVPLVRVAYTGVSMNVDPHGRIHHETEPFVDVNRVVPQRMATFDTIYSRWGDWFELLCALGLLAGLVQVVRRREGEDSEE